ncbi:amidase domain-containing protein [Streptomyces koelreuteriae]|uniref:amidase domain-containing protein n=1 Tax=Streptomyces koelreuteriae TaxID=2838015 RepID=UPI003EB97A66
MISITTEYLQGRADIVTNNGATQAAKSKFVASANSKISPALAARIAKEYAQLARLRAELREANGGYTHAEVQVNAGTTTVNGDVATVEVTEDARLYYPNVPAGDPEYEEYSVPHTLTFVKGADGSWLLDSDRVEANLTGPGPITQLAEPASAPASDSEDEGQLDAGSGTTPTSETDGDKPVETSSTAGHVTTKAAAAGYNYGKMVSYANKYWKKANTDYRLYGSDCTNFISQAMIAGGWKTTSGSITTRKDNRRWFYGSWEISTSYTWAGAENWYWFAKKHSKRTKALDNVWKLLSSDVLQADWKRDGIIDHTMIVTKRGGNGEIYLTYHTPSKHNVKLSTLLKKYPKAAWYAHRT